ncbi:carotenoid oxygenase family protein [Leptolyngbya sp. FACHB-261]|uniref:carotenoid oxygenase family protein n=1 Tax=Leptolyngbya sp. FACHB-261 TaxID=2692806 RepID=UPI001686C32A|nr:carotenoid oxygenase family protein [Leptolyngbya sp. FACHB-261]MBD2100684.1 carotenoid oxygenase family protein [Leptolyngbya sp. FACHB-261]
MTSTLPSQQTAFTQEDWQGGYTSLREEVDYWISDADIEGQLPAALRGTLVRNGPGLLEVGGHPLQHPFDGDGMIAAFSFAGDGRVHFRNRYVRTEGYLAEQAAGRPLYRGVFGTNKPGGFFANAFDVRLKHIANTNVIYIGGKLLALWEAASPYKLDPDTLDTLGLDNLGGVLPEGAPFSAHPRLDPVSGNLVNFGIRTGLSTSLTMYELNPAGEVVKTHTHAVPGFAFVHDFALTPEYAIFFQNPVFLNPIPFLLGLRGPGECLKFMARQKTRILLVPRDGSAIRTLEMDPCFVFHHVNAFQEGQTVVIDSIAYEDFPSVEPGSNFREIDFNSVPVSQLWRFRLDLAQGTVQRELLTPRACEFPTVHPDYVGQPYRHLYIGAAHQPEGNAPLQAILKLDLETGEQQLWSAAPRGFMGEPVFVPFPDGQGEEDGWLLSLVYDAAHQRSDLVILDARDVAAGPVARLHLKHIIPYGLHGSFTEQVLGV